MKNIILILVLILIPSFVMRGNLKSQEPTHQDTVNDLNNKLALFIGDSHTGNNQFGWQIYLCEKTGIKMNNISQIGKTTFWMLEQANLSVHQGFDYCFIYGGANDMYGGVTAKRATKNIQSIVNICNSKGVHAVVITGFNPITCVRTYDNPGYPQRYAQFQQMLLDSIKGAKVIDTRGAVVRQDCYDAICHMNPSGHRKMAENIIQKMNIKTKNPH